MLVILKFPFFAFSRDAIPTPPCGVHHPLQKKKLGSVSEKDENLCEPENHRLRRLHGLGPSANNKRNERTEERSLPKEQILFSLLPSLRGNPQAERLPRQACAT
jgi:hypothetical protein